MSSLLFDSHAHYDDARFDEDRDELLDQALEDYQEPTPGARQRVKTVLRIMLTAWLAVRMRQEAENMITMIEKENVL